MGQFISLLEPDIFLFLGRRTPAASPEQRAPISARCNQLTSSLKRASSHAARLLQDGVHRGAMAGVRMEQQRVMVMMVAVMMMVVMVVTGTPQLASVRGWKLLDDPDGLRHYYKTGQRGGLLSVTPGGEATTRLPDDDDDGSDAAPGAVLSEVDATSSDLDHFADGEFQMGEVDSGTSNRTHSVGDGFPMESVDAPSSNLPRGYRHRSPGLHVVCSYFGFQITLPYALFSDVKIAGPNGLLSVKDAPGYCGYQVHPHLNTFTIPFTGCYVKHEVTDDDYYILELFYLNLYGQQEVAATKCRGQAMPTPQPQSCTVTLTEQVPCGGAGISSSACLSLGCCVSATSECYYPLDACTMDKRFVFALRHNSAPVPLDPTSLFIPGFPDCNPFFVDATVAIFMFGVEECGTHAYNIGETMIYLAEVHTPVQTLNLKYGVITRENQLRFMVECRYSKWDSTDPSLASAGFMLKTPTFSLPFGVVANGLYGVQLKIARDATYSSYYPTHHQPLRLLLGKSVYLELLLRPQKQDAVILVNYCIAYPRSANNALVLIYEGCANTNDPSTQVVEVPSLPNNRYQRRFKVDTFVFMDQTSNKYLDEEILFMCSTEVCMPAEKTCQQQCFDGAP